MSDPIGALVAALLADGDTADLVGTHVFGGELTGPILDGAAQYALVVGPSGGISLTGESNLPVDTQRVDLQAYGATAQEANRLLAIGTRALTAIRRQTLADTFILRVNRAGGFGQARDRDNQWPMGWRSFQILHSL